MKFLFYCGTKRPGNTQAKREMCVLAKKKKKNCKSDFIIIKYLTYLLLFFLSV